MVGYFKTLIAALLLAVPGLAFAGSGNKYYVSSAAELKALGTLVPGDEVIWKDGVYSDAAVRFNGEGDEDGRIVFRAETPGGVVFKGASNLKVRGKYIDVTGFFWTDLDTSMESGVVCIDRTSEHCRLMDCKIDGSTSRPSLNDIKWVSLYGLENEVSGCSFIDKRNMGTTLVVWMEEGIVPKHRILNNLFTRPYTHYSGEGKAVNAQESIRIGDSKTSMNDACCIVKGNYFYHCHGEIAEIISNKTCGNLYENNFFHESAGTLTLRHGNRCTVRNNYFESGNAGSSGGVRIIGEDHVVEGNVIRNATGTNYNSGICTVMGEKNAALNGYWTVKNAVIRGNVLVNCKTGITVNYGGRSSQTTKPENILIIGNTIIARQAGQMTVNLPESLGKKNVRFEDNVIVGGKMVNVSLDMAETEPSLPLADYDRAQENIVKNAGVKW